MHLWSKASPLADIAFVHEQTPRISEVQESSTPEDIIRSVRLRVSSTLLRTTQISSSLSQLTAGKFQYHLVRTNLMLCAHAQRARSYVYQLMNYLPSQWNWLLNR